MLKFNEGILVKTTTDDPCVLSFDQLKGMIVSGQWIELIREFLRDSNISVIDMFDDILFVEDNFSMIQEMLPEEIPAITSIRKDMQGIKDIPIAMLCDKKGFIENNWKYLGRKYYLENKLDGNIEYMLTFADGEVAIRCLGYY